MSYLNCQFCHKWLICAADIIYAVIHLTGQTMMQQPEPLYYTEIRQEGYHIYNLDNAEIPNYYPDLPQDYPGVYLKELTVGDIITIRVYFGIGSGEEMEVDSGYVDLQVNEIEIDKVVATIVSELPEEYTLSLGDTIDLYEEEILCINEIQ